MKRKVALLQVLVPHAPLVIMDEPTNALDPTMRDELLDQVCAGAATAARRCCSPRTSWPRSSSVCDRVGILQRGRLVHVQDMARAAARAGCVDVRFAGAGRRLPALPGLHVREQHGDRLTLEYSGPLPPLLDWLAGAAAASSCAWSRWAWRRSTTATTGTDA